MINPSNFQPLPPKVNVGHPIIMNKNGNVYKMQINHVNEKNEPHNFEIWMTKGAVQKHFPGLKEDLSPLHFQSFAKSMYNNTVRNENGVPTHKGVFITSSQKVHGDPKHFPHLVTDPEVTFP